MTSVLSEAAKRAVQLMAKPELSGEELQELLKLQEQFRKETEELEELIKLQKKISAIVAKP